MGRSRSATDLVVRSGARLTFRFPGRRGLAVGLAVLFALMAARSAMLLQRELKVLSADRQIDVRSRAIERGDAVAAAGPPLADPAVAMTSPRAMLADAQDAALQAQSMPDGTGRQALLDRAVQGSTAAAATRPYWGEATTVLAYARSLRDGENAPVTRDAFRQSYGAAPYLRHFGAWRVQYGLAHWDSLDGATRSRLIDEAVWLSRMDDQTHESVFALARQSPAYPRFMLCWLASRVGDVDFHPAQRPTP